MVKVGLGLGLGLGLGSCELETSWAHLVSVLIVVALCDVWLSDDSSSNLLV